MGIFNPIASGGHTIQDEGSALATRTFLNFVGAGVTATDDSANNATKVTISGSATSFAVNEVPVGTVDGANVTFTLANTPSAGTQQLYLNGLRQKAGAGNDYTISGATITMSVAPASGDVLLCDYEY